MSGEDGKVVRYEVSCAQFGCGSEHNEWDWKRVGELEKKKKRKKTEKNLCISVDICCSIQFVSLNIHTRKSISQHNCSLWSNWMGFFQATTSNNSGRCLGEKKISRDSNALGSMFVVAVVQYGGVFQVCVKEKATKIKCAYCGGRKQLSLQFHNVLGNTMNS